MTKIKICGIRRDEDVEIINEYKPDYAGFVFAKSKRQINRELAQKLSNYMDSSITKVGVFVNDDIDFIADLINDNIIQIAQLHGNEDNLFIENLRKRCSRQINIIKAVRVKNTDDVIKANMYKSDFLLFDSFCEGEAGGNGISFNWNLVNNIERPFFLAGGINSQNVQNAINEVSPYAVDVSSSVEKLGYKDKEKIASFINTVRNINC